MKKPLSLLLSVLFAVSAWAVPARPGLFQYVQPDGSVIMLQRCGDEFFHWTADASGQCMVRGADGFYRPGSIDPARRAAAAERRARVNAARRQSVTGRTHTDNILTHGERHIPVFLVQFKDLEFSITEPVQQFKLLLNQNGYSGNGATGSVQDYYLANSHEQFKPVFDVYPVVTLSHDMAYYGSQDDAHAADAVIEAAKALNALVDFSQYDVDQDGYVDMCLMYYAGYNEAEGGAPETIWPHQSYVGSNVNLDGKYLGRYFCTSELKGTWGARMCGIGTTCHEFGHSLGLPDFYDTNYQQDGQCGGLYNFSLMCSGSYLNESRTPPYFNAEERVILGWMTEDDIRELPAGVSRIRAVNNDVAFKTLTDTEGEYFVYEYRDGSGWDAYLPTGMVVYHIDKSTVRTVGGITPYDQWNRWIYYNTINAYADHPCFYVVPAANQSSLDYYGSPDEFVFPGNDGTDTYSPVDWEGQRCGIDLMDIHLETDAVSLRATYNNANSLSGQITDLDGHGLEGVLVTVTPYVESQVPAGPRHLRVAPRAATSLEVLTDAGGYFNLELEGWDTRRVVLSASKWGYVTKTQIITLSSLGSYYTFVLMKEGESDVRRIYAYDPSTPNDQIWVTGHPSCMGAMRIPASEVRRYAGYSLSFAEFTVTADSWEEVTVVVDIGSQRVLNYKVPDGVLDPWTEMQVDLSETGFVIPEDIHEDLYIGYAVKNARNSTDYYGDWKVYPLLIAAGSGNLYLRYEYDLTQSNWSNGPGYDLVFSLEIRYGSGGGGDEPSTGLAAMGYNSIETGERTWLDGDSFPLRLVQAPDNKPASVSWLFDGQSVTADSVVLRRGVHTVKALLTYPDGSEEELEVDIQVQ
ncbi:MAG: M6 family metalloprotease domain-containing protein [Bacteroidales bacterium]|nr:M6 family metalloprotease domain-containing protein [Bacteroidales bacterium]